MNLNFKFSIREISEVKDSDQTLTIPMYFTVEWEVCRVSTVSTKLPHFMTFVQENRLIIDEDHRSWSDDSTGPKNENTEEAEVNGPDHIHTPGRCLAEHKAHSLRVESP